MTEGLRGSEHAAGKGVVGGEITLERWVDVCSTTPAALFGLAGRKGVLAPGADADLVVYDPGITHTLGVGTHHMRIDNSVWEGRTVTGQARTVLSRGAFVVHDRAFVGRAGHGAYLARGLPTPLR